MRKLNWALLIGAALASAPTGAEVPTDASASTIRALISGRSCSNGTAHLKFGPSAPGVPGEFERTGLQRGSYAIGYGTVLIKRGGSIHSHVVTVSASEAADPILYFSAERFRCR